MDKSFCECCNLCNYKKKKKKDDLRKPIFILYCHKCKKYFTDEKKYNKHLSKVHGEK